MATQLSMQHAAYISVLQQPRKACLPLAFPVPKYLCAAMPQPQVKGNVYKNKRVLMDAVHKQKAEKVREKTIADQFEARRAKGKASRERKAARREERLAAVRGVLCTRTCKR